MSGRLSRLRGPNNEGLLVAVILVVVVAMALSSPAFFTAGTFFALVRSSMVPLIFALGVLMVLISGGIDVSFPAIAIFAAYSTVKWVIGAGADPGPWVIIAIAMLVGAVLGLVNGVVIARFRLPTLIVTLGTQSIFKGVLISYIGSVYISAADLPDSVNALAGSHLLDVSGGGYLHFMIVPVVVVAVLVALLLSRTIFGRSIYAIGGDTEAARRVGIDVVRTQVWLYVLVGALAAFGGMLYVILGRNANPQSIVGTELDIIAAVVLGGASIFGGRGSVLGTVLGVVLVQLINNNLVLLGIPSTWQRAAVGILLLLGVGAQALGARRPNGHSVDVEPPLEREEVAA
ncbi:ABC transporter permease [Isoptericola sp. b441]|uniref:ABC transporter permease n=1 Tax=Actinotalea lenta TaxID=3064654 RepID=A0ABT9DBU3_9CELL|nr:MULTISPECIES: ABC transporter permease [unclassified Isoptericola]MDO8108348.1 ABC transporter permease [Isoptericola sp. b441]MDO8119747.1 ABC transporter permease [Isoptericola sp. b490]